MTTPLNATPTVYGPFLKSLCSGLISFPNMSIMAMLVGDGYNPSQDNHQFKSSVTDEIVGSGYQTGGQQITGIIFNYDVTTKELQVEGGTLIWPSLTANPRYLVSYADFVGATETTRPLIQYIDFGSAQAISDEAFYWEWADGIMFTLKVP